MFKYCSWLCNIELEGNVAYSKAPLVNAICTDSLKIK
jgi:hypothetical protein